MKKRTFLTVRSCGSKACSDGLGRLRRPLSTAVADRSNSGGRKPGRWFLCHSRSTPHHPFGPFRFNWACSAQRSPRRSGLFRRYGYEMAQDRAVESGSNPPTTRGVAGVLGKTPEVAPQVAFSVYSVSVIYLRRLLISASSTEEAY